MSQGKGDKSVAIGWKPVTFGNRWQPGRGEGVRRAFRLAISKGASTLLVPVSARKQLNDLPDDMVTKVNILYYTDAREALLKAIVE
ncbi:MAG: hypothetical protein KGS61_19730 [Verrucomicrobia bacterium]|nr:hypothetical protein [Verrucomicrobiota bacterium]